MNSIRLLIAAFAAVLTLACAREAQGQTPNLVTQTPEVAYIPTGSLQQLNDWMAQQTAYDDVTLLYTDFNGGQHSASPIGTPRVFSSFQTYLNFCWSNIFYGINLVKTNASHPADPNGSAGVIFSIYYDGAPYTTSMIWTNAPSLNGITTNWLASLSQRYYQPILHVPGLRLYGVKAAIHGQTYISGWTNKAGSSVQNTAFKRAARKVTEAVNGWEFSDEMPSEPQPAFRPNVTAQPPQELTTNDWIVLNPIYLGQTDGTRFWVGVARTNMYTQFGLPMSASIALKGYGLQINWTAGAYATIESSATIPFQWTDLQAMPTDPTVTNQAIDLSGSMAQPERFYRVRLN